MTNAKLANVFEQVADLLEFQGANPFRIRAYRSGARTIRDLPEPVAGILANETRQLTDIDGIGKDLAEKCRVLVVNGELPQLQKLLAQIPRTVLDLLRIPSLGPKKAKVLYQELGITTLDALRAACEAGQVRGLKGFGAKTESAILHGIEIATLANQRILWAEANDLAQQLLQHLRECRSIERMEMAGSYRRGRETVGDLDILVVSSDPDEVMDCFGEFPEREETIARGKTKMSLRLSNGLSVDLRVVLSESFGAALQYFTGSKDHNVTLRGMARQQGMRINEYGVYRVNGDDQTYVAGAEEEDVYKALGLPWFPPELRESRREFEWSRAGSLPELVQLSDICGDLHMHTTTTDGKATLEEMIQAAQQRGLSYIAITDHSQRVSMARGLDPQRLSDQWDQIDRLNLACDDEFTILKGIECDILEKGGMDLPDDILARADWVLASIHYGQKQPQRQITDRILGAIENPHVSAIAHPTGRLLNQRDPYDIDRDEVFTAAAQHGKLLELNANPHRLDLNDIDCASAKKHGIPIVINTDAHSISGLDVMQFGILQARRGGLTKDDVANTRSWPQLQHLVGKPCSK